MSRGLSLWLVPEPRACAALQAVNLALSARYGGPRFLPHVTVFAGRFERGEDLLRIVRQAACGPPLALEVLGVRTDRVFYRSVFLALGSTPGLEALSERARGAASRSDYGLEPHLSLFYGTVGEALRREIAASVSFEAPVVRFTELVVNTSPGVSGTPDGVSRWAQTLRLPIGGG